MQTRILIRHFFCANVSMFLNLDLRLRFEAKPYFSVIINIKNGHKLCVFKLKFIKGNIWDEGDRDY